MLADGNHDAAFKLKPMFRAADSTLAKVLRSTALLHARERANEIIEDAEALRALADIVETLDYASPPLSAVADQITAAVRFMRATADHLDRRGRAA